MKSFRGGAVILFLCGVLIFALGGKNLALGLLGERARAEITGTRMHRSETRDSGENRYKVSIHYQFATADGRAVTGGYTRTRPGVEIRPDPGRPPPTQYVTIRYFAAWPGVNAPEEDTGVRVWNVVLSALGLGLMVLAATTRPRAGKSGNTANAPREETVADLAAAYCLESPTPASAADRTVTAYCPAAEPVCTVGPDPIRRNAMFCARCGTLLADDALFCSACGGRTPDRAAAETPSPAPGRAVTGPVGWSRRIEDPEFQRLWKKNSKATLLYGLLAATGIPLVVFLVSDGEAGSRLAVSAILFVFFALLFSGLHVWRSARKPWDGAVVRKETRVKQRRVNYTDGDSRIDSYTAYFVMARDNITGRERNIIPEEDEALFRYFREGDVVHYHPRIDYYEKYDKSHDTSVYCVCCRTLQAVHRDACGHCGCPLLI